MNFACEKDMNFGRLDGGHLSGFQFFLLLRMVLLCIALCLHLVLFLLVYLWDKLLEVGLLGQRVNTYVALLRIAKFLSIQGLHYFVFPPDQIQESLFSQSCQQNMLSNFRVSANLINEIQYCGLVLIGFPLVMNIFSFVQILIHFWFHSPQLAPMRSLERFPE